MAVEPWIIPRIFAGETVVCIGAGPSLTSEQVHYCRHKSRVIVINRSLALASWADVLYCGDFRMVEYLHGASDFPGIKVTAEKPGAVKYGWHWVKLVDKPGFSTDPTILHHGRNGGYQAINLARLMGAGKIILLGYDMRPNGQHRHWHRDDGPNITVSPYKWFLENFEAIPTAQRAGIVNCTPDSALDVFQKARLEDML